MKILNFILYVLAASLLFSACKKEEKLIAKAAPKKPVKDTILHITPFDIKVKPLSKKRKDSLKLEVEDFYKDLWPRQDLNGSFLVAKNGQVLFEKYNGFANIKDKTPITKHTAINLASVSKVLTATVILKLVDLGKLELDRKVNTILPEFPYEDITIKMMLNHRSGLPNYAYFSDHLEVWDRSMMDNQNILDLLAKNKFNLYFKPDKKFGYCNTNYAMLALVIEKLTHMSYREAMKKIIFEPLGMNDSFVFDYEKDKDRVTRSYKGNKVLFKYDFLDNIYGDKNIYSTPRDLLKFDLATYSDKFLNPELLKQVFKGYSYEHKGEKNYGLGIRMHEWKGGKKLFYHNGWWHGNTTSYVTLKKDTVTIIALSNKFSYKPYKVYKLSKYFGDYPVE